LPDYNEDDEGVHEEVKPIDEKINLDLDDDENDDDEEDETTTTTTTTRRSFVVTRNRNLIPTKRTPAPVNTKNLILYFLFIYLFYYLDPTFNINSFNNRGCL
jgi:hypothetical protein